MRPHLITALMLTLAAPVRPSPAPSAPAQDGATESTTSPEITQAIEAVEARFEDALARRDRAALEQLLAVPFTWVHAVDGRVESREAWLASAAQGTALVGQRSSRSEHGPSLSVYGGPAAPHTAVRVVRVRLRDPAGARESWLRQTHVLVRGADGSWRLAEAQSTFMYDGPPLDTGLHARYGGTYVIGPGRVLTLTWEDEALLAIFPNGAKTQVFLASPTEELVRSANLGRLRFTLGPDGRPTAVSLVRGDQEVWRGTRTP